MRIGLTIPTYERDDMLFESFARVYDDSRIPEIVVVDDGSSTRTLERLQARAQGLEKLKLFHHHENVGCYFNKHNAMAASHEPWEILLDSDNWIDRAYLNVLEGLGDLDPDTLYVPTWARPAYDYRAYDGVTITRANVAEYVDKPRFLTALNTGNFLVHRWNYLTTFDVKTQPYAVDSLYFVYCWLLTGRKLYFVPGMHYRHRVHDGSNYVALAARTVDFAAKLDQLVREMR